MCQKNSGLAIVKVLRFLDYGQKKIVALPKLRPAMVSLLNCPDKYTII